MKKVFSLPRAKRKFEASKTALLLYGLMTKRKTNTVLTILDNADSRTIYKVATDEAAAAFKKIKNPIDFQIYIALSDVANDAHYFWTCTEVKKLGIEG